MGRGGVASHLGRVGRPLTNYSDALAEPSQSELKVRFVSWLLRIQPIPTILLVISLNLRSLCLNNKEVQVALPVKVTGGACEATYHSGPFCPLHS
jgi:hypothetical protein